MQVKIYLVNEHDPGRLACYCRSQVRVEDGAAISDVAHQGEQSALTVAEQTERETVDFIATTHATCQQRIFGEVESDAVPVGERVLKGFQDRRQIRRLRP